MDLGPLVTANRAKRAVASLLQSSVVARSVSLLSRHRIPSFDLIFDTRHPAISSRVEAQLLWRLYESAEIRLVRKYLAGSAAVVDLGASLGFTGSHVISKMVPGGHYIAVEPNPRLIEPLGQTLRSHARDVQVEVVRAAITEPGVHTVGLEIGRGNVDSHVNIGGEPVPATTLSEIVGSRQLHNFSLLADIEGAEASLIMDDEALDQCDRLVIELHATRRDGQAIGVSELCNNLSERGFDVLEQQGPVFAMVRRHQ